MNEDCCNLAKTFVHTCLNNCATCGEFGICLELSDFCKDEDVFKKFFNACTDFCRHVDDGSFTAPNFGEQTVFSQLIEHSIGICTDLVNLVASNDDRHVCLSCVVDCFDGLRHNAVICCDHEDCDVGCLCASSTHCCKCFVARGVKERDRISIERNGVCTDMLSDSACFSAGDV